MLASSANGNACFRVKPAVKNYQHLKERLLRRYLQLHTDTRSKSFTKRMMQYVKAYKKGQVHARAVPS